MVIWVEEGKIEKGCEFLADKTSALPPTPRYALLAKKHLS